MTVEPGLEKLSTELIFLKEVYETRESPLGFGELCDRLNSLGRTKDDWSRAWDMLDDQGMLDEKMVTRSDGRWMFVFMVCPHAIGFARTVSEHWKEVVANGGKL